MIQNIKLKKTPGIGFIADANAYRDVHLKDATHSGSWQIGSALYRNRSSKDSSPIY